MKPFAIFGGIVVVGLVLIVGGLRLTNHLASATPPPPTSTPPTPLTHAQFVRAGNAICARYYRADPTLFKHPKTLKMVTRDLRISIPFMEREIAGLRALVPPPRDAGTYRRLLTGVGQLDRDAHAVLHAFETAQYRRGVLIARHTNHLDKHLNSLSRNVGLTVCGLTSRQVKARYG